jgi:alpha-glucosidase
MPADTLYVKEGTSPSTLEAIIPALRDEGFHVVAAVTPGIDGQTVEAVDRDWLLRYPDGKIAIGATAGGISAFPDFDSPLAWIEWTNRLTPLIDTGVDGLLCAHSEPGVYVAFEKRGTLPDYARHERGSHVERHNVYGLRMSAASRYALLNHQPAKHPVVVTRSGYAGDPSILFVGGAASWDQLRLSLSMILNLGLSGLLSVGAEIGGGGGETDRELISRWLQAMVFMPFLRTLRPEALWSAGQSYESIDRSTLELRYRFAAYLYSQLALSREYGVPMVRPLWMAEPDNPLLRDIDDCYLVGNMLVAPILERGSTGRSVYLPQGNWYDFWTNDEWEGGQILKVTAALDRLPLFVRGGTALPLWNARPYLSAPSADPLLLRVYPGSSDTAIYEDDGVGEVAGHDTYRWVYVSCAWEGDSRLIITRRTAGSYEPSSNLIRVEIVGFSEAPVEVRLDRQGAPVWFFDNGILEVSADDSFGRIEITRQPRATDRTLPRRPW